MSYDLFAQYPIHGRRDAQELPDGSDSYARITLFAQALRSSAKDEIRGNEYKNELENLGKDINSSLLANLNLGTPQQIDLSFLLHGSFFVSFRFSLARPYISRDDELFYIIDNPLVKEKVFKRPMVRPSGWKGALRATIRLKKGWDKNHSVLNRFFGTASDNDDQGQGGCFCFYPTFFNEIGLEIINPHDRKTKAGTTPIWLECVPAGACGTFTLLYVPFDRIGEDERETRSQVAKDLRLIVEGIHAMMTVYGFGAKTSSGFGLAADEVEKGQVTVKISGFEFPQEEGPRIQKPDEAFDKYLDENGLVHRSFEGGGEGGLLSNKEYKEKGKQLGGGTLSEFREFRQWYVHYGEAWRESLKTEMVESEYSNCAFECLSDLVRKCAAIETDVHEVQGPIP